MDEDRPALKHAEFGFAAGINHGGDFGVGVDPDKAAGELLPLADVDGVSVIFRALVAQLQQFFEHHRNLHPIGRGERMDLERIVTARQVFVFARA